MKKKDDYLLRELRSPEDMKLTEELQALVWPGSEIDIVPGHFLLGIAKNGGIVIGVFEGDDLIGFVAGILGTDAKSSDRVAMARLKCYSHMLGIHPDHRGRGLGFELKIAQRQAAISQGIRLITWTYDPLMSLNAHLNIRRLGTVCQTYIRNAYGKMRDRLNRNVASDRFEVDWWITSNRVSRRFDGSRRPLDLAHYLDAGAKKLNAPELRDDDLLHPGEFELVGEERVILVEIPAEFLHMREQSADLARVWRQHTREVFEHVFQNGYIVTDFIYLKGETFPRSYYVLTFGESTLG